MAAAQHRFQPKLCHRAILSCGRFGAVRQVGRGQNRCEGGVGARSDLHHPPFPRQRIERESGLPRRTRTPDRGHAQGWCAGRMRTSAISPERGDAAYTTKMCRSAQGLSATSQRVRATSALPPQRRHALTGLARQSRATRRHRAIYSTTSSATARIFAGKSRPSAFAVLRLITSSSLVACSTGRSAGFSPFRIRPA